MAVQPLVCPNCNRLTKERLITGQPYCRQCEFKSGYASALAAAFEAGFKWCANGTDKNGDYIGGSIEDGYAEWMKARADGIATQAKMKP